MQGPVLTVGDSVVGDGVANNTGAIVGGKDGRPVRGVAVGGMVRGIVGRSVGRGGNVGRPVGDAVGSTKLPQLDPQQVQQGQSISQPTPRLVRFAKLQRESGTGETSCSLASRKRVVRFLSAPNCVGMVPTISLAYSRSISTFLSAPNWEGIEPESPQYAHEKVVSDVMVDSSTGMDPSNVVKSK
jgi:hypothetical protein